ncbi:MAG: cation transporter [Lachnospiraceae bacterium]|nr:cation transporter [Lachnospiraceae bacterium]MBR4607226.1 cation transporter [Lachnospiraceae bacterium]
MEEKKILKRLSRIGILGNVLLAAFKLFSGILGKSGAMISDAVHSLSDVFATLIAYVGVRLSQQKEDAEHPYGHERLECVASLILGLILAGTGIGIGYAGVHKLLFEQQTIEIPTALPLIAAVVSIVVKEGMFWYTYIYAKKLDSAAFKADAWHHRSDAISSVGSFIGIGMAKLGFPFMDPIASVIICIFILKVAYDISRDALNKMLDTSCDNALEQNIKDFVEGQPGVKHIDLLRTRQFGNKLYVDLEIAVQRDISLVDAHEIAENVHDAVENNFPNVKHVMIHVNPEEKQSTEMAYACEADAEKEDSREETGSNELDNRHAEQQ